MLLLFVNHRLVHKSIKYYIGGPSHSHLIGSFNIRIELTQTTLVGLIFARLNFTKFTGFNFASQKFETFRVDLISGIRLYLPKFFHFRRNFQRLI